MSTGILGTGSYLPDNEIGNDGIAAAAGTTPDWIIRKTHIRSRRYALPHQATSDLAAGALRAALEQSGVLAEELDYLVVATSTGDSPQPPTSYRVQSAVGAWRAACFDMNVVCSGFVFALAVTRALVAAKPGARAAVVAADLYSRAVDTGDRRTAVLFGDGAGAVVVGEVPDGAGFLGFDLRSRGDAAGLIRVPAGGSRLPTSHDTVDSGAHLVHMEGRSVKEFVLAAVPGTIRDLLEEHDTDGADVDHLVPHQPNGPMLDDLVALLPLPNAEVHRTLERYGNTGSAATPVTLDAAHRSGAISPGDLVLLSAFGGGMATASCLLRWAGPC